MLGSRKFRGGPSIVPPREVANLGPAADRGVASPRLGCSEQIAVRPCVPNPTRAVRGRGRKPWRGTTCRRCFPRTCSRASSAAWRRAAWPRPGASARRGAPSSTPTACCARSSSRARWPASSSTSTVPRPVRHGALLPPLDGLLRLRQARRGRQPRQRRRVSFAAVRRRQGPLQRPPPDGRALGSQPRHGMVRSAAPEPALASGRGFLRCQAPCL